MILWFIQKAIGITYNKQSQNEPQSEIFDLKSHEINNQWSRNNRRKSSENRGLDILMVKQDTDVLVKTLKYTYQ